MIGRKFQAMLLTTAGSDDAVKNVTAVSEIEETLPGHFVQQITVDAGQDVAYAGQVLDAEFNSAKARWEVMHPAT